MGGVDKGLQLFNGMPLALHAARRLACQLGSQLGTLPTAILVNANRNIAAYQSLQLVVWPDAAPDAFEGPLAGFLTGLQRCTTPYLLTVPCDTPLFPLDLLSRLLGALQPSQADIAMASALQWDSTPQGDSAERKRVRPQPTFCLMRVDRAGKLALSLDTFMQLGGRKISAWAAQQHTVQVGFDQPGDNPHAFANANTMDELHGLQAMQTKDQID